MQAKSFPKSTNSILCNAFKFVKGNLMKTLKMNFFNKNRIQPYIAIIGKTNFLKPQIRINQKF